MFIRPEQYSTGDGSKTLIHPTLGEIYHSHHGARTESMHVFIEMGLRHLVGSSERKRISVLEMGFGSGLNALLTAQFAGQHGIGIDYTAVEKFPVDPQVALSLPYAAEEHFEALHMCPWCKQAVLTPHFTIRKLSGDFEDMQFDSIFDITYYDAFAPDSQPELWTQEVFGKVFRHTSHGGILVTYCAKGIVKQALRAAGFTVERLPGAPGKRHMVRAVKP